MKARPQDKVRGVKSKPSGAKDKPSPVKEKPSRVRDRILDTACELFYRHGIHAVGVDAIAADAGTNKMSLYRNFASKEELVAEYLKAQACAYFAAWDRVVAEHPSDPRAQIEALFEFQLGGAKSEQGSCKIARGCALANAAVEIPESDDTLGQIVHGYKAEIRARLRKLCRQMGARDPEALGDALMLLLEGGQYSRLSFPGNSGPVAVGLKAARALMDAHRA